MELIVHYALFIVVAIAIALYFKNKLSTLQASKDFIINEKEQFFTDRLRVVEKDRILATEKSKLLELQTQKQSEEIIALRKEGLRLATEYAKVSADNQNMHDKLINQAMEFERLQKQSVLQFENLASQILKKNSEEFTVNNQKNMNELIGPLRERIQGFEKKVEETYEKGLKDQTDLKAELKKLYDLNSRMTDEANNLTKALKGDVKKQGNWGEIVLERILERSGLTEGQEFEREKVMRNATGKTIRPDVIVNLPDRKHIVIDSKVSLVAYERFVNSDDAIERQKYLKDHLLSLKNHVKELNAKHYTSSPELNTPDFVLLFIPIESSFSIAVEEDQQLFNYAWENKAVIVSPSTLLATLRTIASIWQQENQTKNALEIAKQSGLLYDKFVAFLTDIDNLGKNISTLQNTYEKASNKLNTGTGNLVRRVERLRELGAKTSKQIPDKFID